MQFIGHTTENGGLTTNFPGTGNKLEKRVLFQAILVLLKNPKTMTYKHKSLIYFGCLLLAMALYEFTAPEQDSSIAVEKKEFSELELDDDKSLKTANIEYTH